MTVINWQDIGLGNILTILVLGITGLVAYFGWQRVVEEKFAKLDASVEGRFAAMDKSFDVKFSTLALQLNTILVGDIAGLRQRLERMEADSTDLHTRWHGMTNDINGIGLKVDRLERPRQ